MATIQKNTQVNFKTDSRLLEQARQVFKENDLDLTAGFNLFLQNVVVKNEIPVMRQEELEREEIFLKLQAEIRENQKAIDEGRGVDLETVRERFGLARV